MSVSWWDWCDDAEYPDRACPTCGTDMLRADCYELGCEDGYISPDHLMEIDPLWYGPDDWERCSGGCGKGYFIWCPNEKAHPAAEAKSA